MDNQTMEQILQQLDKCSDLLKSIKKQIKDQTPPKPKEVVVVRTDVNQLMEVFYKINPSLNFGNKTTRDAAEWLIDHWGLEKAIRASEYACSVQGQQFAPVITTPYQLKEKIAQLKIYKEKQENNSNNIRVI